MSAISCVRLSDSLWQLTDFMQFRAYLLVGTRRAMLIDALCGCGDLMAAVRAVTDLPVTVALTHCHFDHIGGAYFFPEVLLSGSEQAQWQQEQRHLAALREVLVDRHLAAPEEAWCLRDGKRPVCREIREGGALDLGGLTVQAVALPGHTAGSMGYLCPQLELLFSGDAVTPIMCLFFPESGSLSQYRQTLQKMENLPIRAFYTGHHANAFPKAALAEFQECAAFAQSDRGMYWQHDILPEYRGTLHVYRGNDSEAEDFLALISRRD